MEPLDRIGKPFFSSQKAALPFIVIQKLQDSPEADFYILSLVFPYLFLQAADLHHLSDRLLLGLRVLVKFNLRLGQALRLQLHIVQRQFSASRAFQLFHRRLQDVQFLFQFLLLYGVSEDMVQFSQKLLMFFFQQRQGLAVRQG